MEVEEDEEVEEVKEKTCTSIQPTRMEAEEKGGTLHFVQGKEEMEEKTCNAIRAAPMRFDTLGEWREGGVESRP